MEKKSPLEQEIMSLRQELAAKNNSLKEKNNHIKILENYILSLKQKQFGSSSEKLSPTQAGLFDEADGDTAETGADNVAAIESIDIPAHSRSKKRVSIPADIPRIDIVHDLPDDQKVCPHDGTALKRIGSETHEQLDIIPATVQG